MLFHHHANSTYQSMAHGRHLPYSLRTRSSKHVTEPKLFLSSGQKKVTQHLLVSLLSLCSLLLSLFLGFFRRTTLNLILFRDISWLTSFRNILSLFSMAVILKFQFQPHMSHIQRPTRYLHLRSIYPKLYKSLPSNIFLLLFL